MRISDCGSDVCSSDLIASAGGGRNLISVADDGKGMGPDELPVAVERHATSKLPSDDLMDIRWLGFRGEALPSIGAVGRMAITSRRAADDAANSIEIDAGRVGPEIGRAHV